jgi:hypothetical protein
MFSAANDVDVVESEKEHAASMWYMPAGIVKIPVVLSIDKEGIVVDVHVDPTTESAGDPVLQMFTKLAVLTELSFDSVVENIWMRAGTGEAPGTPRRPCIPAGPVKPVGPVEPNAPTLPCAPATPVIPACPEGPMGPRGPSIYCNFTNVIPAFGPRVDSGIVTVPTALVTWRKTMLVGAEKVYMSQI